MIKGSFQQEEIMLINIYTLNVGTIKCIEQILTDVKEEIDSNTVIVEVFNTLLILVDRSSRPKINKETMALSDTLGQINVIDIFQAFHLRAAQYTLFSSTHETFSNIDHMLDTK